MNNLIIINLNAFIANALTMLLKINEIIFGIHIILIYLCTRKFKRADCS